MANLLSNHCLFEALFGLINLGAFPKDRDHIIISCSFVSGREK